MRSRVFIIVLFCVIAWTCTRDNIGDLVDTRVYVETPAILIGSWNWLNSSGGFTGMSYSSPETTGEIKRIEFDANNNYKFYINEVLKSDRKFQIEKGETITSQDSALIINNIFWARQSITFRSNDTLILFDECYDCYEHYFIRIK
jgi:hypothetical protein